MSISVAGGLSIGCSWNCGAAGTYFDASVLSLRVGNDNFTTETETPLLLFSTSPLWTNVYVENNAKVLVPLLWTRVQVHNHLFLPFSIFLHKGLACVYLPQGLFKSPPPPHPPKKKKPWFEILPYTPLTDQKNPFN